MLDIEQSGAAPDSPTGPLPTDPSSAGTQNTEQPGQGVTDSRGNVIPPWRVNELVQRASESAASRTRQEMAQEMAAERERLEQRFAEQSSRQQQMLLEALQQRAARPSRSPQEEAERQQAQSALSGLLTDHPEWARMQKFAQAGPALAQAALANQKALADLDPRLAQLEQRQAALHVSGEVQRLRSLATAAGIPVRSDQEFDQLNDHVADIIARFPAAHQAFLAGDPRVLPAALEQARKERAAYAQPGRAAYAETKTATRNLPPPLRGGVPGSAAAPLPKFNPADPGARERAIWKQGRELLAEKFAAQG